MIYLKQKYPYVELSRGETSGGRKYITPDGRKLPSVTTILSQTADKSFLTEWRNAIGDEKADKILYNAGRNGTLMHQCLENYILNEPRPPLRKPAELFSGRQADLIIKHGLSKVDEVWGVEVPLWYPGIYAGTTDLVGIYEGEPAIMDYKTASTMRTDDMVTDYYCQGCAYAYAHNHLYQTNINKVVLFMVTKNLQYKPFVISGDRFEHYLVMFADRVAQWYDQNESAS